MWNKRTPRSPDYDQLSVLIGVILLGLAITQFVQLPSQQLGTTVFGSPLGLEITSYWMIVSVLVILASAGTDMLIRSHPRIRDGRLRATAITWVLPGLTVLVAARGLILAPNWPLWWTCLIVTGVIFGAVVAAEYALVGESQTTGSRARLFLNILSYGVILIMYAIIYQTRSRSLITATSILLVSFLVALNLLRVNQAELGRVAVLAGAIGLVMGECGWALNYWQASMWSASLLLLLTFYTASGLTLQYLEDKLSRLVLSEFAGVAVIGIGLLITFRP